MTASILGIDAGGTETHARMQIGSRRVFDGRAGRANITSTPAAELATNLAAATSGCPRPDIVAGCFAGLGSPDAAAVALYTLERLFPDAEFRLASDYVAVALASQGADVVVLAGTGSIVVSRTNDGLATTGGLGHLLGDHGSAFRYGQALLEHLLLHGLSGLPAYVSNDLCATFGDASRATIIRAVYGGTNPAQLVSRLAPTLSRLASERAAFAMELVDSQASALADDVALHITRHVNRPVVQTEVAGGVWQSIPIYCAFGRRLRERVVPCSVELTRARHQPVDGAIRLGSLARDQLDGLVQLTRPSLHR